MLAALFFGLASAAQHHATHRVTEHAALHPGLVLALLRQPWWLCGAAAAAVGLGLQVAALANGSIIMVQAVMVTSLAWTTAGESLLARCRPGRRVVSAIVLVVAGQAGLLALLDPLAAAAPRAPTVGPVTVVIGGCAVAATAGLVWSAHQTGPVRALGLAVATGCGYGLTAALLKLVGDQFRLGWDEPLRHPALYAACLLGSAAVLLSQNALQHGHRATPSVAVVLLVDPVVGLATGVLWFGEQVVSTPATVFGALVCVAVTVVGIATVQSAGRGDGRREGPRPRDAVAAHNEHRASE